MFEQRIVTVSLEMKEKEVIATHNCIRVDPHENHVHHKLLCGVQHSGKSKILITNGVMLRPMSYASDLDDLHKS